MVLLLLAGLAAAGLSWLANGLAVGRVGRPWIVLFGPALEELLKSGIPLLLGVGILGAHVVFGVLEALRDLKGKWPGNLAAGVGSLTGHFVFGWLAATSYQVTGAFLPAVAVSLAAHVLWNATVVLLSGRLTGVR